MPDANSASTVPAILAVVGAVVAAFGVFLPWVVSSGYSGYSLNGFEYEGVYLKSGLGGAVLVAAGITFAGGLALLSRDSGRGGALVALAASIGVAIVTLMALGKINEGIGGNPLITSLAGGEVGGGVYVTIGGAVVAGVGALIGLAGPRPGPRAP